MTRQVKDCGNGNRRFSIKSNQVKFPTFCLGIGRDRLKSFSFLFLFSFLSFYYFVHLHFLQNGQGFHLHVITKSDIRNRKPISIFESPTNPIEKIIFQKGFGPPGTFVKFFFFLNFVSTWSVMFWNLLKDPGGSFKNLCIFFSREIPPHLLFWGNEELQNRTPSNLMCRKFGKRYSRYRVKS